MRLTTWRAAFFNCVLVVFRDNFLHHTNNILRRKSVFLEKHIDRCRGTEARCCLYSDMRTHGKRQNALAIVFILCRKEIQFSLLKSPTPFISVLFDGARSALPPKSCGKMSLSQLSIIPREGTRCLRLLSMYPKVRIFHKCRRIHGRVIAVPAPSCLGKRSALYASNSSFHAASSAAVAREISS